MLDLSLPDMRSTVSGASLSVDAFQFAEPASFDPQHVINVLNGESVGVIFRNLIPKAQREAICANFWRHPGRYQRGAEAPGHYIGTFHYHKELPHYFADSAEINPMLSSIFEGVVDPVGEFRSELGSTLAQVGRTLRAARWNNAEACRFLMRSWIGGGSFALLPHEDLGQCTDPRQRGFEIQEAAAENTIASVNMCLENTGGGGLRMWNVIPDKESRAALGLTISGSPYPLEVLDGHESFDVAINPGDVYVFDGRYVHAVTSLDAGAEGRRATIAFLMANKDARETICWT